MKLISVNIPETYLEILEIMVADNKFPNRSEAIRIGVRDLIKNEFLLEKSLKHHLKNANKQENPKDPEQLEKKMPETIIQ
ncbi:MAG: CopG family transcriptional regulator [Promethearchaeota archaeon]|nr:MAG: CopG family transcriptional regulator [Candidatus Lokiarchaeota archaeon]